MPAVTFQILEGIDKGRVYRDLPTPVTIGREEGNPLVWFIACDSVRLFWDRLRIKAEVPNALSFKFLCKYAGDWTTRRGEEAMGMIALSHARTTVLAKNYSIARDFVQFNELQRKMHAELTAAGMFNLEKQTTRPEVTTPDGPVVVEKQHCRCRTCGGSFSPSEP